MIIPRQPPHHSLSVSVLESVPYPLIVCLDFFSEPDPIFHTVYGAKVTTLDLSFCKEKNVYFLLHCSGK